MSAHRWKFFLAGGVDQVALRDGKDIVALGSLDQKLWVALAMPTRGVELDPKTLDHLDTDKDARIRAPEIVAAVEWIRDTLKNPDDLLHGRDVVELAELKDTPVLTGARRILDNLGKKDATSISLADVSDTAKIFAATQFNGDGIIPDESADNLVIRAILADIRLTHGEVLDRSGKMGVDQPRIDAFFTEVTNLNAWKLKADATVLPLGEATPAAAEAFAIVKAKVDDWFTRCKLAALDVRASAAMNGSEVDLEILAQKELSATQADVARLPLAHVEAGALLPLGDKLNPYWSAAMAKLAELVVEPLLGKKTQLSDGDWTAIKAKLAPYEAWMAEKPVVLVEKLGVDRLQVVLEHAWAKTDIDALVVKDLALEGENAEIQSVEKLILFQRDLYRVLNNFVNFADFYGRKGAAFQAGVLFLDGRSCHLVVQVADAAKHATLALMASAYLAYCDCTRPNGEKMTIAAAFTDGDSDHLLVGRNGIFYDRKGRDWDATITKVIANPISVREAFWSPYKKLARLIEQQVGKRAAAADAESNTKLATVAAATATADKTPPVEPPKKIDVGTVAAIGVAVGGIGAFASGILGAFFGLGLWMPIGVGAVLMLISGPSMLLAWLKLRQRNLGPILDANGWAINGRAKINVPFGAALTDMAKLPAGSTRALSDPFAEKTRPWMVYLLLVLLIVGGVAWYVGKLDRWLPEKARSTSVLKHHTEAGKEPSLKDAAEALKATTAPKAEDKK